MVEGVDFLRAARQAKEELVKSQRPLKKGTFIFLIVYCFLAGAIFFYWVFANSSFRKVQQGIELKKEQISELGKVESLQVLLKQRLFSLTKIVFAREPGYKEILLFFEEILPNGVSLTGATLDEQGGVEVNGVANNAVSLADFFDELLKERADQNYFAHISLADLARGESGDYNFSLSLKIND